VLPATEVVISNPRTYYGQSATTGEQVRTFVYGVNVAELSIQRKLAGVKVPTIEVRTNNIVTGERLSARYPPVTRKKNNRPAVGVGDREEIKTFVLDEISGPQAQQRLESAARSIYEQFGRGEMSISIRTKHMAGLEAHIDGGIEADLFRLRPSDTIMVEVDTAQIDQGRVAAHTLFANASPVDRKNAMVAQGIPEPFAEQVAAALENRFIQTEFRTKKVNMNWDYNTGWEFQVDAINFLDVRDAVSTIDGVLGGG
jgi:hypothetical protein